MHNVQMRVDIYIEVQCVWRLMGMKNVPYVIVIEYKFIKISLHVAIHFLLCLTFDYKNRKELGLLGVRRAIKNLFFFCVLRVRQTFN